METLSCAISAVGFLTTGGMGKFGVKLLVCSCLVSAAQQGQFFFPCFKHCVHLVLEVGVEVDEGG